ncbi:hypothetical protein BRADO6929 [Bradyrhizobium sp. ORS 278]|uniref:hypothetical protein n=1 Tax=Bradyrhizobium sp. (strain ORS 278) TaxID=114615 RepID=UPI0001508E17|nr:hypothetical protein [Bradyrhizobium sp. ORS 278]CAL80519.1 hypothetical protein BRADO6929 [Bradyrhizobium sp. ORS 278]
MINDDVPTSKHRARFDPTINYGHVLTVVSFVIAGAGAYFGMRVELEGVDQRVAKIESTLQQLASVLVVTARQDERLIAIERRVDWLEEAPARK